MYAQLILCIRKNGLLSSSGNIIEPAQCNDLGGARRDQTTKRILFWYKNDEINLNEKISVKVAKQSIDQVLHGILVKQGLSYTIDDKHIIIYKGEAHSNMDQKEKRSQALSQTKIRNQSLGLMFW